MKVLMEGWWLPVVHTAVQHLRHVLLCTFNTLRRCLFRSNHNARPRTAVGEGATTPGHPSKHVGRDEATNQANDVGLIAYGNS